MAKRIKLCSRVSENMRILKKAKRYLPGGVNSPVRSFVAVGLKPIFLKKGYGSKIYTEDNKKYIDYCMSWGTLIFGHSDKDILKATGEQLKNGTSFGFTNVYETELAEKICKAIPSIEKIRFVNSGTEATMSAVRLACEYTGKKKILKFGGCYHGSSDLLLNPERIFVVPYNDIKTTENTVKKHHKKIACIIVEPVAGNMGVVLPEKDFLYNLRDICNRYNIILIFDEVITGFRFGFFGAQKLYNINPDLTCLGKIIGGGFPIGAYGGSKELMKHVSPSGNVYQAGTFSGNPVTMIAGLKTLEKLKTSNYKLINDKTEMLCKCIITEARKNNIDIQVNQIGSMFSLFFTKEKVHNYTSAKKQDIKKFKKFYSFVFQHRILFSPSPFEANFVSFAHTEQDIEKTIRTISYAMRRLQ